MTAEERLAILESLARKWTARINLVAPSTLSDFRRRHIDDSGQVADLAPDGASTWCDLGSGGGFPGLVVAALRPDVAVTLIESDQRKCAFLRTAAREMGVSVTVLDRRIEETPPQAADVVSARALAALPTLLPLVAQHLSSGGTALLMKGREVEAELDAARAAGWAFAAESLPSRTDPQARILRLTDLVAPRAAVAHG